MAMDKNTEAYRRAYARRLMEQGEALLRYGELAQAEELADRAIRQQATFGPFEAKPQDLMSRIAAARRQAAMASSAGEVCAGRAVAGDYPVAQAGGTMPANSMGAAPCTTEIKIRRGTCRRRTRRSRPLRPIWAAPGKTPKPCRFRRDSQFRPGPPARPASRGVTRLPRGRNRAESACRDRAYQCFQQAAAYINELDQATAQRLQSHLQLLSVPTPPPPPGPGGPAATADVAARQQALARQLATELGHQQTVAHDMLAKDPKTALAILEQERTKIETANLDPQVRDAMLRSIGRSLVETQQYIQQNRPHRIGRKEQSHPPGNRITTCSRSTNGRRRSP